MSQVLGRVRPIGLVRLLAISAVSFVLAACGSAIPVVSFDPSSACTTDGRLPGAYPELEALLPTDYDGRPPDNTDSGRNCTPEALGVLANAGIEGVRFAGSTWSLGGRTALTIAVFEGDGLDPASMIGFYQVSARTDRHTEKLEASDTMVGDAPARRLDVLATDGTGQTIVAWPSGSDGRVFVLLAADLGDARVADALETLGSR